MSIISIDTHNVICTVEGINNYKWSKCSDYGVDVKDWIDVKDVYGLNGIGLGWNAALIVVRGELIYTCESGSIQSIDAKRTNGSYMTCYIETDGSKKYILWLVDVDGSIVLTDTTEAWDRFLA
jgi:hypothetical protein